MRIVLVSAQSVANTLLNVAKPVFSMYCYGCCVMKLRNGVTARTTSVKAVPTLFCVYFVNYFVTIVFSNQTSVMYYGISRKNPFMRENLINCKESVVFMAC